VDDLASMRARLREMLQRVPPKINNAGTESTREFLAFHKKATAVATSKTSSRAKVADIYNQARQYYS
jgi:hypothetical protein